jgi:hypothetical protein
VSDIRHLKFAPRESLVPFFAASASFGYQRIGNDATQGGVGLELFEFHHRTVFVILLGFQASPGSSISSRLCAMQLCILHSEEQRADWVYRTMRGNVSSSPWIWRKACQAPTTKPSHNR